jgi:hypothetical protein
MVGVGKTELYLLSVYLGNVRVKKFYQIADKLDSRTITELLSEEGQLLFPTK